MDPNLQYHSFYKYATIFNTLHISYTTQRTVYKWEYMYTTYPKYLVLAQKVYTTYPLQINLTSKIYSSDTYFEAVPRIVYAWGRGEDGEVTTGKTDISILKKTESNTKNELEVQ